MKGQRGKEINNEAIIFFKGSGVLPVLFQVDGSDRIAEFGSIQCQHALKAPLLSMNRLNAGWSGAHSGWWRYKIFHVS